MSEIAEPSGMDQQTSTEQQKFKLEQAKFRYDVFKWAIAVAGAIISFAVIDLGKLRLEEFRVRAENQRALLQSYLGATDAVQPDVWKRKLRVLRTFADDASIKTWADRELDYIQTFAAADGLYRETVKVASQLVASRTLSDAGRQATRARYEQLYWADLPFIKEDRDVSEEMVNFRRALVEAEKNPGNTDKWSDLELQLLKLSRVLHAALPPQPK